jgi:hypothetical protein
MPAQRLRSQRWRELLQQVCQRNGGVEIAVNRGDAATRGVSDLMWRVRLLSVGDADMVVEQPAAAGRPVRFDPGTPLVGVVSVGQNRWVFHSEVLPSLTLGGAPAGLRLSLPQSLERCMRRDFLRVSTAQLRLPEVECWILLDPTTVGPAEAANRQRIMDLQHGLVSRGASESDLLPEVGAKFSARLMNIGGGGVGLLVGRADAGVALQAKLLWLRINLMPDIPAPLAVTARVAHSHLDSAQDLHVGAAFNFEFNPSHRLFVVEQITRYANLVQGARRAA